MREECQREKESTRNYFCLLYSKHVDMPAIALINMFSLTHSLSLLFCCKQTLVIIHTLYFLQLREGWTFFLIGTILFCSCIFECVFEALMTVKVNILYREVYMILLWLNIDFSFSFESRDEKCCHITVVRSGVLLSQREKHKRTQTLR